MYKSIKSKTSIIFMITELTTIILTIIVVTSLNGGSYTKNNLIVYLALILLFMLVSTVVSFGIATIITKPLKKFERAMKSVAEGKLTEIRNIKVKDSKELAEVKEFTNYFNNMMNVIRKNNFDLNTQQTKTEIILEHMADGVIAFSVMKQLVHINKSGMRLLNIAANQFQNFDEIMKYLNLNVTFDDVLYLPNYKSIAHKIEINENILNIVFVPFFSERLMPMGVIMVVKNITESVKLENMRKEFVATVSHELRTPLTSIRGYSETIADGDNLTDEQIKRFATVINEEANRMGRLVGDLLQLSRFDYNKVTWKKMMFDIEELSEKVIEKMQILAEEKNHTLRLVKSIGIPKIYADPDAIEQVLVNIITNSIKYTPDNGRIELCLKYEDGRVYIKILDNGIGIPEEDLSRIFERFYRVDKARSRKMGGTGLGLSIVKEIVDGNNGTIDIKSKVNQGTEVIISLPVKIELDLEKGQ